MIILPEDLNAPSSIRAEDTPMVGESELDRGR